LIQAGIKEVVGPRRTFKGEGAGKHYSIDHAEHMLKEAGVLVTYIDIDYPLEP
jgi:hypothetical protein